MLAHTHPIARRTALVARIVLAASALAALSACGPLSTRGAESGPPSTAAPLPSIVTTTPVTPSTVTPTVVLTTPPSTAAPTTAAPTVTLPPSKPAASLPLPAGSLDLGKGVTVSVAPGWSGTSNNGLVKMSSGDLRVALIVIQRTPGEHPKEIVDEYVELALDVAPHAQYSPATLRWTTDAPRPAMQYEMFYSLDAGNGTSLQGGLHTFVRDDGLTLLYDVWAPTGVTGALPDDTFDALLNSFLDAPQLNAPAPLNSVPEFRVTTIHPQ